MYFDLSLKPVINYLHHRPHAGFIVAFLVSFLESVPVIGTIIPGSITMTAMGALVGSGVLPASTTFGWAILGALSGDSISYFLGYRYYRGIRNIWPLSKYPKIFSYGETFFKKHGAKSLLIGRFVGPMRSAIPMVAGVMRMHTSRFFFGACPSAILWALAYMLPGVLVGALSQELPHGKAAEFLFGFIMLLVICWLFMWLIKWSMIFIMRSYNHGMQRLWRFLSHNSRTSKSMQWLQQHGSPHEHQPLNYILLSLLSWLLFFIFMYSVATQGRFTHLNTPIFYLLQSMHSHNHFMFWAWVTSLAAKPVIFSFSILLCIWLYWRSYRRSAYYLFSLSFITAASIGLCKWLFYFPRPGGQIHYITSSSFPSGHTTLAMAIFGFTTYLLTHRLKQRIWQSVNYSFSFCIILMVAYSRLYLGSHWLTDITGGLCLGAAILFPLIVLYRRFPCEHIPGKQLLTVTLLTLITPWIAYSSTQVHRIVTNAQPNWPRPVLTLNVWWQHPTAHLPIYRLSRLGHPVQPFNLQWAARLQTTTMLLTQDGWKRHRAEERLKSIAERLITLKPSKHMPLLPALFQNLPPATVWMKTLRKNHLIIELRLWKSGATLREISGSTERDTPIWLGNISYHSAGKKLISLHQAEHSHYHIADALDYIKPIAQQHHITSKVIQLSTSELPINIQHLRWNGEILLLHTPQYHTKMR